MIISDLLMKMFKKHNFTSKGGLVYSAYAVGCLRI